MGAPRLDTELVQELAEFFRSCSLFAELDPAASEFAAQNAELISVRKGDPIILENESNDGVHFIVQGAVEIVSYLANEKRIQRLALLKEGVSFGEFSILTQTARSGSAYAYVDCVVARVSSAAFLSMLETYPGIGINLLGRLARMSHSSMSKDEFIPFYVEGSSALTEQALQVLPQSLWKKFNVVPLSLKSGVLSVAIRDPHNEGFYSYIKSAYPKLEVSVSIVGERDFATLLERTKVLPAAPAAKATPEELDVATALQNSTLFSACPVEKLTEVASRMGHVSVKAGELIVKSGQKFDECYVILRGAVQMSRPVRGSTAVAKAMLMTSGSGFGQEQVLLEETSSCSCRAMEDTDLLVIPKDVLNELLDESRFMLSLLREIALHLQTLGHVSGLYYVAPDAQFDFKSVAGVFNMTLIDEEKIIPLKLDDGELTIGFVSPESSATLVRLERYVADYRVRVAGLTPEQFRTYRAAMKSSSDHAAPSRAATTAAEKVDVVKWVNGALVEGFQSGASDIHFEPSLAGLAVRYRIDGVLRESAHRLAFELMSQATSRLKIMSGVDIAVTHLPQDGHLQTEVEKINMQARLSTLPLKRGEKIVLRLIREKNSVAPLDMITPDRRVVNTLRAVGELRQGLFLVTGPTGSGKTSTLYSLLKTINQVDANVISIEDPVEMELRGVNQVEINVKRGLEFHQVLRSVLRQDPDVVMVGEIRDNESANAVFDAATTGCLVLSTLHSGTSFDAVHRLKDLGISPAQIAEGLVGVVTQRLLRKVCSHCAREQAVSDSERAVFERVPRLGVPDVVRRGEGCASCGQSGYQGRLPVFETWLKNPSISDGIRAGRPTFELETIAREQGFETLFEFALRLVKSGTTTLEEVRRVLSGTGSLF